VIETEIGTGTGIGIVIEIETETKIERKEIMKETGNLAIETEKEGEIGREIEIDTGIEVEVEVTWAGNKPQTFRPVEVVDIVKDYG
jgi:shikimate kinase